MKTIGVFDYGTLLLLVTTIAALYAAIAGFAGQFLKKESWKLSAIRANFAVFPLTLASSAVLVYGFMTDRFDVRYIAYNSERNMPFAYKLSAFWGSLDGSLLLWLLLLSAFSAWAMVRHRRRDPVLLPVAAATLALAMGFFSGLMLVTVNPFELLDFMPANGLGLNPLLQNPGMAVHPPMMYVGFTGLTIPFAFAVAALVTGQLDARWLRTTRLWTIISWVGLTLGNLLGANWAYVELGWGGYWGWDPVENSALMPWFTVTAFLHSAMVQERRGMLKVWNLGLILLSFWLTIFGTFLTRSGVVSSVHAFSDSNLGGIFLAYLGVIMVSSMALLTWRWDQLKPDRQIESVASREAAFLFNNLLLLTIALIVLWGTTWPILLEAFTGKRASVGAPLFNQMNALPGLLLLFLMGVGPVMHWRRMPMGQLARALRWPAAVALVVAIVEAAIGSTHYFAIGAIALSTFVLVGIGIEYRRGIRGRRKRHAENPLQSLYTLFRLNPRRYAGYLVHLGSALVFLALAGNLFATEHSAVVRVGETIPFGESQLTLREIKEINRSNFTSTMSVFDVEMANGSTVKMWPEKRSYKGSRAEQSTEVSIHSTLMADLYLIVLDRVDQKRVSIRVHRNPLVQWLWIGGAIMALGGLIALTSRRRAGTAEG